MTWPICASASAPMSSSVRRGMGMDPRIGNKVPLPGRRLWRLVLPRKDVKAVMSTAREVGWPLTILESVDLVNERQKRVIADKVIHKLAGLEGNGPWATPLLAGKTGQRCGGSRSSSGTDDVVREARRRWSSRGACWMRCATKCGERTIRSRSRPSTRPSATPAKPLSHEQAYDAALAARARAVPHHRVAPAASPGNFVERLEGDHAAAPEPLRRAQHLGSRARCVSSASITRASAADRRYGAPPDGTPSLSAARFLGLESS